MREPIRTCAGCRARFPQRVLVRFVLRGGRYEADDPRRRGPGRGAYLCSRPCAERVRKNRRFAGLADCAEAADWRKAPGPGVNASARV